MYPSKASWVSRWLTVVVFCLASSSFTFSQGTGGRILGRVADPSGAVLAGVTVTATNEATGVSRTAQTNDSGDYGFPEVPIGTYTLAFDLTGFKTNVRKGVSVELNQVVTFNSTLQIGETKEVVEVTSEAPLVDTTSTQLGAIVNNKSVNELPLNARDSYQFLQLQPGVQSQLGSSGGTLYGSDAAGSVSVNGGRGRSNNFSVNGGDANDAFVNLPTVQPSPDAIEEFRVITNTFDAEYGRNSGAVVNVVTKSGTNALHGNVYEYFRNTVLNSQGYFNTVKPKENQNQFGGTLGGPIKKDRTFFFTSYEGRRVRQGISGPVVPIPTPDELPASGATFATFAGGFPTNRPGTGVNGVSAVPNQNNSQFVVDVLQGRSAGGQSCPNAITSLGGTAPKLGALWNQMFPNGVIPVACMDPVALNLLQQFSPAGNRSDGTYQAVPVSSDTQDQFTMRFDHRINDHQNLSVYYYYTDDKNIQPFYGFQASGANIPGYGTVVGQRFQQWNPSHTWTINNSLVNEARFTYMREGQLTFQHPQHTGAIANFCTSPATAFCFTGTSDSSAFQTDGLGSNPLYGIHPGLPTNRTGLPFINVSGGVNMGNGWEGELPQVGNTFQWADNLSWVKGNHTLKFGVDVRRSRFDQTLYFNTSGNFTFDSSGPNAVSYADNYPGYLLGLPDTYSQGSAQHENVRNTGFYLFAQDSWKIKPNLTFNYGLRWELDTPLTDAGKRVQTFRPGQKSVVYPCDPAVTIDQGDCPTGLVVPGDPGVPGGLTSTYYKAFAPRVGLAYSPNFNDGFLGKLFGNNGKTSIRTGWGLFYNPMEQLVLEQFSAEPPFGSSPGLSGTLFNTPFVSQGGNVTPNGFNGIVNPVRGKDPGWADYRPILLFGDFQPHLRTQYTAQYNFSIQREIAKDLLWQINYVGSQGHRLLASHDINASNPQTCLDMISISNYYALTLPSGDPNPNANQVLQQAYGCAPVGEDSQFILPAGSVPAGFTLHMPYGSTTQYGPGNPQLTLVGLRPYSSPNCDPVTAIGCPSDGTPVFTNIFAEDTIANSSYNSLQTMLEKRFSHGLQLQAAYTFSKSLDLASSFEETLNPFNFKKSRALSLFNSKQRFVINYYWELPFGKHEGWVGKVVDGWAVSGITQFQSGFPIRVQTQNDNELINSLFFFGTGAPQLTGKLHILDPKKNGGSYLDPNQFSDPSLGTFSTTPRTLCCGPGENQWDMTFSKRVSLSEARYFQFRADIFNVFNKTQFVNPDGNFSNSTFGQVLQARDPRLVQFALKFYF